MSERLPLQPAPVDSATIRPASSTRLPIRNSGGTVSGDVAPSVGISLDTMHSRIHALPPLSPAVIRALQLADRETISAREMAGLIGEDIGFGARVVNAANAPCYKLPRPVASVSDAILLLGTDAVREALIVAAVRDIFYRPLAGYGLAAKDLWAHSVACAMASEIAADISGYGNRTEAFLGGLLHDVGKIILDDEMQSAAARVREHMGRERCTFVDAEREILGYDHCDIGARVARTWAVPQHIVQAIALHRKPVVIGQTVPLAGLVHLGEVLCSMAGVGTGYEGLDMTLDTRVLRDFRFTEEMGDIAMSRLVDKLSASVTLLTPTAETHTL